MNEQTGAAVKTGAVVALVQCAAAAVLFVKRPDSLDAYSVLFLTLFLICWGMLTWASFTGGSMKTAAAAAVLVELGGALFALRGRDYAVKQAVILAASALAGCAAAFACSRLWRTVRERPVRTLLVCAGAAAGVFLLLLAFGSTVGGTRAWLRLGPLSVQLTELLKPVTLVAFSVLFGAVPVPPLRRYLLAAAFLALDAVILVCLSELGTLLLLVLLFLLMTAVFLPARCSLLNLAGIGGAAAVGIPAVALLSRMDAGSGGAVLRKLVAVAQKVAGRVSIYLHPARDISGSGYQLYKARQALAIGGFLGADQCVAVPVADSDFAFVTLVEYFGALVGVAAILAYLAVMISAVETAQNCPDDLDCGLALGSGFLIFAQAAVMILGSAGLIPCTGLPVPYLSAGGTYAVVLAAMTGFLLWRSGRTAPVRAERPAKLERIGETAE